LILLFAGCVGGPHPLPPASDVKGSRDGGQATSGNAGDAGLTGGGAGGSTAGTGGAGGDWNLQTDAAVRGDAGVPCDSDASTLDGGKCPNTDDDSGATH
jgi:hypothetical protein